MIYSKEIFTTKSNETSPLFLSKRPVHSKYNPSSEKTILPENYEGAVVVFGIGGGFHIKNLIDDKNISLIIAVEADEESLEYSLHFENSKKLKECQKAVLCTQKDFITTLIGNYLPALHSNITAIFLRSWENENKETSQLLLSGFNAAIKHIKADFSVQSHFGLIWQRNILLNLRNNFKASQNEFPEADKNLTSAVIAAGPTLDSSIKKLKENRKHYFIISTDTAYPVLLANDIIPEIAVCVDAQRISARHFMTAPEASSKNYTTFIFDICSNPKAAEHVLELGHKIKFIQSGHPLSALALCTTNVPFIHTGSGTVTIACCDIARIMGFSKTELFGADFSYTNGKPYANGTYLERNFGVTGFKTNTTEQLYTSLMFRTKLIPLSKKKFTTEVLEGYKKTLEDWAISSGLKIENNILLNQCTKNKISRIESIDFNFNDFFNTWKLNLENLILKENFSVCKNEYLYSLLPFIAFLKKHEPQKSLHEYFKLALNYSLLYN